MGQLRQHWEDDFDRAVIAVRAGAILAHAALAGLGLEVLLIPEIDQRVEVCDAFDPDIAAFAAVAAVRSTELDEFFAAKTDATVSARA